MSKIPRVPFSPTIFDHTFPAFRFPDDSHLLNPASIDSQGPDHSNAAQNGSHDKIAHFPLPMDDERMARVTRLMELRLMVTEWERAQVERARQDRLTLRIAIAGLILVSVACLILTSIAGGP